MRDRRCVRDVLGKASLKYVKGSLNKGIIMFYIFSLIPAFLICLISYFMKYQEILFIAGIITLILSYIFMKMGNKGLLTFGIISFIFFLNSSLLFITYLCCLIYGY